MARTLIRQALEKLLASKRRVELAEEAPVDAPITVIRERRV
jgi:hypothetical protein